MLPYQHPCVLMQLSSWDCAVHRHSAYSGAFRKMVAGEVKELRSLLTQQAVPQLSSTIQLLDGPIASAGSGAGGKASKAVEACALPALAAAAAGLASVTDAAVAGAVAADADIDSCSDTGLPAGAFSSMADVLSSLGPTANDLVKDYAEAYASMKENMEIRLRHEQRRGDFLQVGLREQILRGDNIRSGQCCVSQCCAMEMRSLLTEPQAQHVVEVFSSTAAACRHALPDRLAVCFAAVVRRARCNRLRVLSRMFLHSLTLPKGMWVFALGAAVGTGRWLQVLVHPSL